MLTLAAGVAIGCSEPDAEGAPRRDVGRDSSGRLFTLMPASHTGIRFANRLQETNERNVFTYRNYYNGGGAAIGDLNGDGLPEVILTANEKGPRLYLNEGGFRFRDVTVSSGLKAVTDSWTTGVTLADVNADGRLDIYLSRAGLLPPERRGNELWINQGTDADSVPTFREVAARYGVDDRGYSTHAAFFDYDRDGDLDLFVINNSPRPVSSFALSDTRETRHVRDPYGGAQLYRNDGERFSNVTAAAGIHSPEMAFGLGVVVSDVNRDGWPDLYVANDFFERDYLFINRRNGTFVDDIERQMPVITYFSMGLDIADLNNDGWPDIYTTDMLPEDPYRLKATTSFEDWQMYWDKVRYGYHHQLSRNMLQRNNGDDTFSDVAHFAGVEATDWTWSALVADLDLDGLKDIFVTNGMAKDITAQDYLSYLARDETMKTIVSGGQGSKRRVDFLKLTKAMPVTAIPDYAFRNLGGLRFANEAAAWGLATPSFSSGAAYGDLDGDGSLDLVVNNTNGDAFVYRNNVREQQPARRFLRVRLEGAARNTFAVGARVTLFAGGGKGAEGTLQIQEVNQARGFQSSVDYVLVFGIGARDTVDSVRVDWPDGRVSVARGVATNQTLTMRQSEAGAQAATQPGLEPPRPLLENVTDRAQLRFAHRENEFVDFDRERLMPRLVSTEGPTVAVGDANGDGLEDAFVGGAKGQGGQLFLQRADGQFSAQHGGVFGADSISEDVGAAFFDADGDRDLDLYVVSGGSEYSAGASALQDRLYLNDGRGGFRLSRGIPNETLSGSRVVAHDYDADGDVDLFIGGRVVPWRYGTDPKSMLLRNDGGGRFTDVIESLAPALARVGMVTDAVWSDIDGDGRGDLVVVGEWMPISVFRNEGGGRLAPRAVPGLEKSHGWWNRIVARDVTGDGRVDFVVGNLGLNTRLRASEQEPATMHVKDFDRNGFVEQVMSVYSNGVSHPMPLRDELLRAVPALRLRFPTYKDYAGKTVTEIFPGDDLADAVVKKAHTFATSLVRSNADGSYTLLPLPAEAQLSPVYGILVDDIDANGTQDVLLAGNFDGFKPEIGRQAASYGVTLLGDGKGGFTSQRPRDSGFRVPGQTRDIARVRGRSGDLYVVARNNDTTLVFRPRRGR